MALTAPWKGGGAQHHLNEYISLTFGREFVLGCTTVVLDGELAVPCTRNPL